MKRSEEERIVVLEMKKAGCWDQLYLAVDDQPIDSGDVLQNVIVYAWIHGVIESSQMLVFVLYV